jgi:hypothetical protein
LLVLGVCTPLAVASMRAPSPETAVQLSPAHARATAGESGPVTKSTAGAAARGHKPDQVIPAKPHALHLIKANGAVFDVRHLVSNVVKQERPERETPVTPHGEAAPEGGQAGGRPRG